MKKTLKGIAIVFLALVFVGIVFFVFAKNAPPSQIVSNFTELSKIEKISRYRSCAGHTTVPQDEREMKRSMKHYFRVKPEYLGDNKVEIYSPYNGFVTSIREDLAEGLEGEIWITPKNIFAVLPPIGRWAFSVQHIYVREGLERGSEVKAGELIGYAAISEDSNRNTFDVVYAKGALMPRMIDNWMSPFSDLDSVFNQMSRDVFAQYQARGIVSKENLIISKEERDQNPCVYKDNGPYFLNQESSDNWEILQ